MALLALAGRVSRVDLATASEELSNKSQPLERSPLRDLSKGFT